MRPVFLIALICLFLAFFLPSIQAKAEDEFALHRRFDPWNGGSQRQQPTLLENSQTHSWNRWNVDDPENRLLESYAEAEAETEHRCWSSFWFIMTIILFVTLLLVFMAFCVLVYSRGKRRRLTARQSQSDPEQGQGQIVSSQQRTSQRRQLPNNTSSGTGRSDPARVTIVDPSAPAPGQNRTRGARGMGITQLRLNPDLIRGVPTEFPQGEREQPPPAYNQLYPNLNMNGEKITEP